MLNTDILCVVLADEIEVDCEIDRSSASVAKVKLHLYVGLSLYEKIIGLKEITYLIKLKLIFNSR